MLTFNSCDVAINGEEMCGMTFGTQPAGSYLNGARWVCHRRWIFRSERRAPPSGEPAVAEGIALGHRARTQ
ncbi:hypothetical protein VTO42DRAFT_8470 [Malbranchea cinnamomea]